MSVANTFRSDFPSLKFSGCYMKQAKKKIQWIRNIFLGSPEKTEISLNISFRDILQFTKNTSSHVNALCIKVWGKIASLNEQWLILYRAQPSSPRIIHHLPNVPVYCLIFLKNKSLPISSKQDDLRIFCNCT